MVGRIYEGSPCLPRSKALQVRRASSLYAKAARQVPAMPRAHGRAANRN